MMTARFIAAVRFFRENAGYVVGERMRCAWALAKAEERAKEAGLRVVWEDESEPWYGDCPAPPIIVFARVPDDATGRYVSLASLGMIGLNSWSDPYVRVVEAELFSEALDILDERRESSARAGSCRRRGHVTDNPNRNRKEA